MWSLIPLSLLCVECHTFIQLAKDGTALSACLSASTLCSIWYLRDRIMTEYKAACGRRVTPEPVYPAISTCLMVPKLQLPEHTFKLSPLFDFPALTFFFSPPSSALCLVSSPEASQVLGEQAEMHKSPEWLFVEPGSNKCSCGKILHPWRLWYDWCKYMRLAHVFVYIAQLGFLMLVLTLQHCRFFLAICSSVSFTLRLLAVCFQAAPLAPMNVYRHLFFFFFFHY